MWVVLAKKGLDKHRDDLISEILNQEIEQEPDIFITNKKGSSKYSTTSNLSNALIYKQEASCKRLIQRFQKSQTSNIISRYDKFYWVKEYHISYRKVTKDEWNRMCNNELGILLNNYEYHKSVIEKKRNSFK